MASPRPARKPLGLTGRIKGAGGEGITFAFSRGADFEDKYSLLEGVGKVSKNVRLSDAKQVNRTALRHYIKQAIAFDQR